MTANCPSSELLVSDVVAVLKRFFAALSSLVVAPSPNNWVESCYERLLWCCFMLLNDGAYFFEVRLYRFPGWGDDGLKPLFGLILSYFMLPNGEAQEIEPHITFFGCVQRMRVSGLFRFKLLTHVF